MAKPTKAISTDDSILEGNRHFLKDAIFELGYGDDIQLIDAIIERNVIDFSDVNCTKDIWYQLEEHYGECAVWSDLRSAVACELVEAKLEKDVVPYFEVENVLIYNDDIFSVSAGRYHWHSSFIPKSSVDLIVTSPPYNVDIHYDSHADDSSYDEYLEFTEQWLIHCYELSKDDGRFCLNIPLDKNKGGQQAVCADITKIAKSVGWQYHSTIIWNEGNISRRTAWGSWMSASAPYVIAPVEVILVLYKKDWKKTSGSKENDITREEFMEWTNGVWTFPGQNKKGAGGHPAPFPVELPKRCIKLFSFVGDTVLDPFLGSGSTLIAAYQNNRKGIGVEIDKGYCDIAINRLKSEAKIDQRNLILKKALKNG